jgi:uncharacterized protein (TIGR02147 family)
MEIRCFDYTSYKSFLKAVIDQAERRGMVTELAEAAGCQRSYLSQVLNGPAQLTPDHAFGIADHLRFTSSESDYFLLLVDHERAATLKLRKRLSEKLESLRREQNTVSRTVQIERPVDLEIQGAYFSSWHMAAIHAATSMDRLQTVESISSRLSLSKAVVESGLERLLKMGLVKKERQRWLFHGGNVHLDESSPWNASNHHNWRARAILDAQTASEGLHYTSVFTLSQADFESLRKSLLRFIDKSRKEIAVSPSEELASFCCDLFKV